MAKLQDTIKDELQNFGLEINEDGIINRLATLCSELALEPSDLADEWMAFSVNNSNLDLDLEGISKFKKYKATKITQSPQVKKERKSVLNATTHIGELFDDILDGYLPESSPVRSNKPMKRPLDSSGTFRVPKISKTPTRPSRNKTMDIPSSLSPVNASPSQSYSQRKGTGEVVCTYNEGGLSAVSQWGGSNQPANITMSDTSLKHAFKYMFQKLSSKAESLDEHLVIMSEMLARFYNLQFENLAIPSQGECTVVGRVCCDTTGKINAASVMLEGSLDLCHGKSVPVDLKILEKFAIFPGQIVAMAGTNPTGRSFVPTKICDPVPLKTKEINCSTPLSVFCACGPFTSQDSLAYEALSDLIGEVSKHEPDVLILIGPFVDIKHPLVEKGDIGNMTVEDLFISQINHITENVPANTKVVIVPSQGDITCDTVYPQPPPEIPITSPNVILCPDPVILDVKGVTFAITSTDVLFHLSSEEISHPPGSDRMGRLAGHLLHQQNFYPLHPPSEHVNIDYPYFIKHCFFDSKPHILLLPSDLRYFVKNVQDTVVVNPGKLGRGSGTYLRMFIKCKDGVSVKVTNSTLANIVKI